MRDFISFSMFFRSTQELREKKAFKYITSRKARQEIKAGVRETNIIYLAFCFLFSAGATNKRGKKNGKDFSSLVVSLQNFSSCGVGK